MRMQSLKRSIAELLSALPESKRAAILKTPPPEQLERMEYQWKFWARPNQLEPEVEGWRFWLVRGPRLGQDAGRRRVGAQTGGDAPGSQDCAGRSDRGGREG